MKTKTITGIVAIAMIALSSFTANKRSDVYKVDTKLSSLEWFAEKVSGKHNGAVQLSKGEIKNDNGSLSGTVEVNMITIEDKDLQDTAWKNKLERHLKSADFFDVAKFPKSTFEILSTTPIKDAKEGGYTHHVKGNLTIKDKTNPISFDATIKTAEGKIACVGTAVVDRSKFDIKYGSKSFFPNIGDKMINDEFKVQFNIVAVNSKSL